MTTPFLANNKGYSYSDGDFTVDAKDISIGASLTKLTLNGTAEIGTIETNVKNIQNEKFITIASGFAPATTISVLVSMSYIGGQVYPSEGMQVATVEDGASINGMLVYYNTDFSISDDGKLAGPPEAEYSYSYYNSTEGFVTTTKKGSFQDAVTAIKNSSNAGTIKILADSIDLKQTASFPYETTITSDHDVTFTKGFTGGPMFELPSAGSKNLVSFTADAGYNITIKGANDGDNPVFSMPTSSTGRKLDLTNVTIQDNTVSGNGGAIRLTNDAGVKLTNVTIQHCSAGGYGGAVYHEDCGNNVGGVKCENVIFNNNNAKGGSAIYVDGVTGVSTDEYKGLIINGCTFTGNSSTNETASTPAEAVKLDNVIYVDCISGSFNQSVAAELKNTNTFTGNTTYSDINLGSNMATMSNLKKSVKLTNFSLSTDRADGKLKVVVGSYSVSGTAETCVFYTSVLTPDQLNTMAGNFSLTADKSGNGTVLGNKAILPHSTASYTLTVKEPEPKRIIFNLNSDKISATDITGGTVTYNQDDYGKTLPQGSLSMSSVGGATYAVTATPGHTITFTANLNAGYQLKSFTVTGASGSAVSVTKVDDTTYTFVMPNEEVTVDATVRTSSSITVVQPESGSITVTVPDMTMVGDKFTDVEDGTTVTLSATGDDFVKWSITNAGGTDVTSRLMYPATSKDKSFKMPPYDITITAKVKHDITVNAAGGTYMVVKSTDTSTAITKAAKGDKIWVDLTPNTNYKLTGVTINKAGGETVSYETYYDNNFHDDASLLASGCMVQFYMPDEAVTINVTFKLDACEITTSVAHGTISDITSPAPIGSAVNFTLTPENDTYKLGSYKVFKTGDESTSVSVTDNGDGTYTFTMPEYPVTVSASFIKKTHDVTITKDGEGTVSISPETPVTVGETVTVAATPGENWELSTLTMNGTDITSTKLFTMPNEAVSIHAVFVKKKFAVTVDVTEEHSENGAVVCEANGTAVEWGTEVNFTVEPNQYYDVDTVTVNGMTVTPGEDGKYKFDAAAQENKISATFKKQQFKLKDNTPAADASKGTVAIIKDAANVNDTKLDWGTRVTVTVTPEENWEIDTVKINGKDISEFENDVLHETMRTFSLMSVSSAKTYTVLIPTYDAELVVTYKKSQFTVTKSATENGTISIIEPVPDAEGNIKLDWDETVKINVTPDSHYDIDTVTVDGTVVAVDAQGDYSFTMPTHDVTIRATFKKTKYSITGTGDHVTFDIPSTSAYDWGDTVEFTATPDQWYNIRSVTADNATVTITKVPDTDNTYSFTMPSGNITITAITERPNFSVTFASNGGSSVAAKVVANGDAVAKPEVPVWAGRGFAGWYLDEECTQKYDFTQPVTGNLELHARWFLWGDVNNDGVADSYDALLIRRCRVGLTDYNMITNRMAGFVNGFEEGRRYPDSGDAVSIRRYRVGLISRYKVEDSAAGYEYDLENDTYIPKNQ